MYDYLLVPMDVSREVRIARPKPIDGEAQVNQFLHADRFPDSTATAPVTTNVDTFTPYRSCAEAFSTGSAPGLWPCDRGRLRRSGET